MSIHHLDRLNLARQYILSPQETYLPPNWHSCSLKGLYLATHPWLPLLSIYTNCESLVGWLLGWPITNEGKIPSESLTLALNKKHLLIPVQSGETAFEQAIYTLGGRWIAILVTADEQRLYLDPCGSQATVYCPLLKIASATTALIPYRSNVQYNQELVSTLSPEQTDGWYPFGLTPRRNCYRLLPNHFLDLQTWQAHRHWPNSNLVSHSDRTGAVQVTAQRIKQAVSAAVATQKVQASLTAGMDTRLILACSRSHIDRIQYHTREGFDDYVAQDIRVATRLARRFHLKHEVIAQSSSTIATEEELENWQERVGRCVAGVAWKTHKMVDYYQQPSFTLTGSAGEIARAFYWKNTDSSETDLTPERILKCLRLPKTRDIERSAQAWLDSLTVSDSLVILDLLYLEQRVGCYLSPNRYGFISPAVLLLPLNHREIIQAMLGLPSFYKRENRLHIDVIKQEWPELLAIPFNGNRVIVRLKRNVFTSLKQSFKR
ncbi:hypothetical protein ACL6C3_15365 [Capilliphycus salinus ALCB114379]|uniref:hypothetical protein n=1 Tax=Capilliphycus salinus TaxID=2768948 RepID=UPI0039A51A38